MRLSLFFIKDKTIIFLPYGSAGGNPGSARRSNLQRDIAHGLEEAQNKVAISFNN